MSIIPEAVQKRLNMRALEANSLQNPNFQVGCLDSHEPPASSIRYTLGAANAGGLWSCDGVEHTVYLIAQVSGHHTFIGPYGDAFSQKERATNPGPISLNDLLKAKRKISVAIPHTLDDCEHATMLRRQFQYLQDLETDNLKQAGANKSGSHRFGFAYRGEHQWRASAVTMPFFYCPSFADLATDDVPAARNDPLEVVKKLPEGERRSLYSYPLEAYDLNGNRVKDEQVIGLFKPGTWVEISCTLFVQFPTKDNLRRGARGLRTYQLQLQYVQALAEGRIKEGPLQTEPIKAGTKRKVPPV